MPTYTIVRSDNGHVVLRTDKLADLPDKRTLAGMRMRGAVLYEDGKEVTGKHLADLMTAKEKLQTP